MNINATLIGQSIAFFFFVWFCMKYVWPPLMDALKQREKKIAEGLAAADRGKHEQQLAEKKAKTTLQDAKSQAADIVNLAQKRANEIVEEAKNDARTEGDRLIEAAKGQIEQETNRARETLREQVGGLIIAGAEKVLAKEIDAAAHQDVVEQIASKI